MTVVRATSIQAKQDDFDGVMAVVTVNTDNNIGWFTFGYGPLLKIRVETASIELPYEDIKDITANWKEGFSTSYRLSLPLKTVLLKWYNYLNKTLDNVPRVCNNINIGD